MAKQPETIDRFLITAEAPPELVGPALAALARLGINKVDYQFRTDVLRFKGRSAAKGADVAAEFVKANARFTKAHMVQHFRAAGLTNASAYLAIKKLKAANVISESDDELVRVEAITGPASAKGAKSAKNGMTNLAFVQKMLRGRKTITSGQITDAFKKDGRVAKSVHPVVSKLVARKALKRTAPGEFAVLNGARHG